MMTGRVAQRQGFFSRLTAAVTVLALVVAACGSNTDSTDEESASSVDACATAAAEIVAEFDSYLEPFSSMTPEEFLAIAEPEGREEFNSYFAQRLVVASEEGCSTDDLNSAVERELGTTGTDDLRSFLASSIIVGNEPQVRSVSVSPSDDLTQIISTLANGSEVILESGEYLLSETLVLGFALSIRGVAMEDTVIRSSAAQAVIAITEGGALDISDLTLQHTGDSPASVLVSLNRPVTLERVRLAGGKADAEQPDAVASGGSGIVLSTAPNDDSDAALTMRIIDSEVIDNEVAGIAILADFAPEIASTLVARNGACGLCAFGSSSGRFTDNRLQGNDIGVQVVESAKPLISGNEIIENLTAGVLVDGEASPTVTGNTIADNETVGIDVQGTATPELSANAISGHEVGIAIAGSSVASVSANEVSDSSIGIQVSGGATPVVEENVVTASTTAGLTIGGDAAGSYLSNTIETSGDAAVFVTGSATPTIDGNTISGGVSGIVIAGQSRAVVTTNRLADQEVGIEVSGEAVPTLDGNEIANATSAAMIFGDQAGGAVTDQRIIQPASIGIQISGGAMPSISNSTIEGGVVSVLVVGTSSPELFENTITEGEIAIEVADQASPIIRDNKIVAPISAGMVFLDESSGQVRGNKVTQPGAIGIQFVGSSAPNLEVNSIEAGEKVVAVGDDGVEGDDERVGLLFGEQTSATATGNAVIDFRIGVQVGGTAQPVLELNTIDGGEQRGVGIIFGEDSGGRAASNRLRRQLVGIQVDENAAPDLEANIAQEISGSSFLALGASTPRLSRNQCFAGVAGIAILDGAVPELIDNDCSIERG